MNRLFQDFRYGIRMLLKNPGFAFVAVVTLALGIAVNTAVFSWIETVLLRPLPGVSGGDLISFEGSNPDGEFDPNSYPDYRDYRDHLKLLSGLAVATPSAFSVGEDESPERVWGELVSGNYFSVLGVKPILGRVFSRDEYGDKQGGYPVAVLSENLWNRLYNGDPTILGRTIRVNRQRLTIIGVAPASFRGSMPGLSFQMWVPAVMAAQLNVMPDWMLRDRQSRTFFGIGRLKPGVHLAAAQAEARALSQQLARDYPDTNRVVTAAVLPISKGHFGAQSTLGESLRILMAVCGVVLLIVCANVANLLLARATARRKEFGLRLALGASRWRLLRQMFSETLLLALLAAIVGAPLAISLSRSLSYLVPQNGFPVSLDISLDSNVLLFTTLLCLGISVLSGVAPALQTGRADLNLALNEGGRTGSAGAQSQRLRSLLVSCEVALALIAIIGAGLFARSFQLAQRIDPGFDPRGIVVSHLYLASQGYKVPDRINFCARLRQSLETQPGIAAVAYADYIPLGFVDGAWEPLKVEGFVPGATENMNVYRTAVSPGYFTAMRIPLLDGRDFTDSDDQQSQLVMIVNQKFAARFFASRNPIGRKVNGWGKWFTIVGLVKNTKFHMPNEDQRPLFYVPFRQVLREDMSIAVYARSSADAGTTVNTLTRAVHSLDPGVGVYDASTLSEYITASLFAQKIAASLLGSLGLLSLVLSAVGLYSVMAYSIAQRTQEIGIRMALGAKREDVLALVLGSAMRIVLAGLAVGLMAAAALTRAASGLLVGVTATDPVIFCAATVFLAAVAAVAAWIPALHAIRIDPNVALHRQ